MLELGLTGKDDPSRFEDHNWLVHHAINIFPPPMQVGPLSEQRVELILRKAEYIAGGCISRRICRSALRAHLRAVGVGRKVLDAREGLLGTLRSRLDLFPRQRRRSIVIRRSADEHNASAEEQR